jgi:hypothetical protein
MMTPKDTETKLLVSELKKEILRLQKKNAKLEAENISLKQKAKAQPTPKLPKSVYDSIKKITGSRQPNKPDAANSRRAFRFMIVFTSIVPFALHRHSPAVADPERSLKDRVCLSLS